VADQSQLDQRYFIDESIYNCPFCNRRHVSYSIYASVAFNWTEKKPCYVYFVKCHSCYKESMHLTFYNIHITHYETYNSRERYRFRLDQGVDAGSFLDKAFFYSVPTSFFVMDERVPRILRELLTEAEGCLKSNFLTGASACARKIVYELAALEEAQGDNYEDRIKSLKKLHPEVEPTFFDTLMTIQQITSAKVHENSYDGWESKHLRIILASLSEVLHGLYVVPALREDRRKSIIALKEELISQPASDTIAAKETEK
jgi:hypothetical protein